MKILIATDGSVFSDTAIDKACELLKLENMEFKVVSVFEYATPMLPPEGTISPSFYQQIEEGLEQLATVNAGKAAERMRKNVEPKKVDISTVVLNGFPDQQIIEAAKDWNADLIVLGSHGWGFWGRLLGSVSNSVVHHAPCAVMVVRKI